MKNKRLNLIAFVMILLISQGSLAQMKPQDGSQMAMSKYSYSETVDILKGAIEQQNLMVINEIDAQKMLRMAGKQVDGMSQIFYFHP